MRKKDVPLILQSDHDDCGLACLVMALNHFGGNYDISDIRKKLPVTFGGINFKQLCATAEEFSLSTRVLSLSTETLRKLKGPLLLFWSFDHAVIYDCPSKIGAWINDPSKGRYNIPTEELEKFFTGICIEFSPMPDFSPHQRRDQINLPKEMLAYSVKNSLLFILPLIILTDITTVTIPISMKLAYDNMSNFSDQLYLYLVAAPIAGLSVIRYFMEKSLMTTKVALSKKMNIHISTRFYRSIMQNHVRFFYSKGTGSIVNILSLIEVINDSILPKILGAIIDFASFLILSAILFWLSPYLFLVTLLSTTLSVTHKLRVSRRIGYDLAENVRNVSEERSICIENVKNVYSMKAQGLEGDRRAAWENAYVRKSNSGFKTQRGIDLIEITDNLLFTLELVAFTFLSIFLVSTEKMSFGSFLAYTVLREFLRAKAKSVSDGVIQYSYLKVYCERLRPYLNNSTEKLESRQLGTLKLQGSVDIVNLSFKYSESDSFLIEKMNLSVESGETVLIRGASGSGKSSLVSLLIGLEEPTSGCILYEGNDVRHLTEADRNSNIIVITQNSQLFSGSIADNITLFSKRPNHQNLVHAAKSVNIFEKISKLPLKFDTPLTDVSQYFSAGEIQRILLARCFYFNPPIIILDEATSNLDSHNEEEIFQKICALRATKFIVTHHPSSIISATREVALGE